MFQPSKASECPKPHLNWQTRKDYGENGLPQNQSSFFQFHFQHYFINGLFVLPLSKQLSQ